MPTVVFDFDSTLISTESLEKILDHEGVHEITAAGIRGEITFAESLRKRLQIASPTLDEVVSYGKKALSKITPGMEMLVKDLHREGVDVWVVSGGLYESLLPVCQKLEIPESQIYAVKLLWSREGFFQGIDPTDPFSISKVEGVRQLQPSWHKPVIAIGDATSDYNLFLQGYVDHFILFTQYYRCKSILDLGVAEAGDVDQLREKLEGLLHGD